MLNDLIVRAERAEDYHDTELMTMRSFWNKYYPGCTEHNMIRGIRASTDYLPEISRVAEADGKIVGAVYYTRAWIVDGGAAGMPAAGSDVQFDWNHKLGGVSRITKVVRNLLEG